MSGGSAIPVLASFVDQTVSIITNDGRNVVVRRGAR